MSKTFKINKERERHYQNFDKEKIEITKAGKIINVYSMIQENREDTEIYPTLEKYGCIDRLKLNTEEVYADLRNIKDMRSALDQVKEAENIWLSLPLDTRKEFGHSKKEFMEKGEKWLKNKIEEAKAKVQVEVQQPSVEEGKVNEQK